MFLCMEMPTISLHSKPTFPKLLSPEPCYEERQRQGRETLSLQPPKESCSPSFPSVCGWQAEGTDARLRKGFCTHGIWLLGTLH